MLLLAAGATCAPAFCLAGADGPAAVSVRLHRSPRRRSGRTPGVAVYGLVIAGMLYSALQYRGAYAAWFRLAALLFVFSDSVIAWGRFVAPVPCRTCVVMITYYAAQYLFYLFAVRAATLSDSPH